MAINPTKVPTTAYVFETGNQSMKKLDKQYANGQLDSQIRNGADGFSQWLKDTHVGEAGPGQISGGTAGVVLGGEIIANSMARAEKSGKDVAPYDIMMNTDLGPGDTSVPLGKVITDAKNDGVIPAGSGIYGQLALMKSYEQQAQPAPGQPQTADQKRFAEAAQGLEYSIRVEVTALRAYKDGSVQAPPLSNTDDAASHLLLDYDKIEKLGVDGQGSGSGDGNIGKKELEYAADPKNGQPGNVQLSAQYLLAHWDELVKVDGETDPNASEVHVSKDDVKKFLGIGQDAQS